MQAYQKILPAIRSHGATLIAISPQTPDHSLSTAEKNGLEFEVLSDLGNRVARNYRLVFRLPEYIEPIFTQAGFPLPQYNADETWELPIPGTFVVDRDLCVRLAYVDADYTTRLEPKAILECLQGL